MVRTAFDLRKSTFWVCPSLFLRYALWDLSQVYRLMLTVSQSCEDSVTDNYSVRSSGWVLIPESLSYGIVERGGQELLSPGSATYNTGSVTGLRLILLVPCWLFIPAPSAKNFSFFTIVLSNKDIISSLFKLHSFQRCYVLYRYSISSCQRN